MFLVTVKTLFIALFQGVTVLSEVEDHVNSPNSHQSVDNRCVCVKRLLEDLFHQSTSILCGPINHLYVKAIKIIHVTH